MKVTIGPYKNWRGPHTLAEKVIFWHKYERYTSDPVPKPVEWLGDFLCNNMWIVKTINWFSGYYVPRRVKIYIDEYDVWSADHTMSQIIYPMLLKLKEVKHGSPDVDDADVPEHLRSSAAPPVDPTTGMVDDLMHDRWNWVLDEMIWAHGSIIKGDEEVNWYDPLPPGTPVRESRTIENDDGSLTWLVGNRMGIYNKDRREAFIARQKHGLYLFGKYYRGLWD